MANSNFRKVSQKILDLLNIATDSMCSDVLLLKSLEINELDLRQILKMIVIEYMAETNHYLQNPQKLDVINLTGEKTIKRKIFGNSSKELYCVIPIKNINEADVQTMLHSIIGNLKGLDFGIVVYSNKIHPCFSVLDEHGIDHVVILDESEFSLPTAYNSCIDYLKKELGFKTGPIMFMDDDAYIVGIQKKQILENLTLLKTNSKILAVSGHCYDTREISNYFYQSVIITNRYLFNKNNYKPYCHGGAAMFIDICNFPEEGLPLNGLGGINLIIGLINKIDYKNIKNKDDWFLINNPDLKVFHRIKDNIISWTATYFVYNSAWAIGLNKLSIERRSLWNNMLNRGSKDRVSSLVTLFNQTKDRKGRAFILGNILLTRYYKPKINEHFNYADFKDLLVRKHVNLI